MAVCQSGFRTTGSFELNVCAATFKRFRHFTRQTRRMQKKGTAAEFFILQRFPICISRHLEKILLGTVNHVNAKSL